MTQPPQAARFDTSELLAHAAKQARERGYADFLIVDADAHHYETECWAEITEFIDHPVVPFLSGEAKRQILGENARRLFRLTEGKTVALRRE